MRERINNKKIVGNKFKNTINVAKNILLGQVLKTVRLDLVNYCQIDYLVENVWQKNQSLKNLVKNKEKLIKRY